MKDSGYGMPSSHAQFAFFFSTYVLLSFKHKNSTRMLMIIMALIIAYSRVYLYYHTINQIFVGSCLGCTNALLYYGIVLNLKGILNWIVAGKIGEVLFLRNPQNIQNLLEFDRQAWLVASSNKDK
jgi:dolichyldiphosphatase